MSSQDELQNRIRKTSLTQDQNIFLENGRASLNNQAKSLPIFEPLNLTPAVSDDGKLIEIFLN